MGNIYDNNAKSQHGPWGGKQTKEDSPINKDAENKKNMPCKKSLPT